MAHPNCQQKLVEIWYTGVRKLIKMNKLIIFLLLIGFIFLIPIGALIFMIAPKSKVCNFFLFYSEFQIYNLKLIKFGKFMCLPSIKFITFTISYIVFIIMLVASSLQFAEEEKQREKFSTFYPEYLNNFTLYFKNENLKYKFETEDFYIRNNVFRNIDLAICVWLIGILLNSGSN